MDSYRSHYTHFKRNNPQIISYRNKRWAVLIAKWSVAVGVILTVTYFAHKTSPVILPIGIFVAVGLPLWQLRPWRCFQRGRLFTVESIDYEDSYENVDGKLINPRYNGRHTVTYAHFAVRDGKGKKRTFKLDRKYETVYLVGDRLMNISGLDYPIDLTVQGKTVCPQCGAIFPSTNERCVTIGCKAPKVKLGENA